MGWRVGCGSGKASRKQCHLRKALKDALCYSRQRKEEQQSGVWHQKEMEDEEFRLGIHKESFIERGSNVKNKSSQHL